METVNHETDRRAGANDPRHGRDRCPGCAGAGVAATVSLKDNVTCRDVDISRVQKALKKQGVRIE